MKFNIKLPVDCSIGLQLNTLTLRVNTSSISVPILPNVKLSNELNVLIIESENRKNFITQKTLSLQALIGLTQGFKIKLNLVGIGYKHFINENKLYFKLNKSHLIYFIIPEIIDIYSLSPTALILKSTSLQILTQFKKKLSTIIKPNVYKKKGIFFYNENIILKKKK